MTRATGFRHSKTEYNGHTDGKIAACSLNETYSIAITNGSKAIIINSYRLKQVQLIKDKRLDEIRQALSRCKLGSRRWKKLRNAESKIRIKTYRQMRDFNHKITRKAVDWCIENEISVLIVGDIDNGDDFRIQRGIQYKQGEYLNYKAQEAGIKVRFISQEHIQQTCPGCGCLYNKKNLYGNQICPECGLSILRDVIDAMNIRNLYLSDTYSDHDLAIPKLTYINID
jgi:putative transposase